jgi:hypothetical protein
MTILWELGKLQGKVISLRSSTQLENLLSLRLQPANTSNLILFSNALLKAVNRLHRQKASCSANLDSSEILDPPILDNSYAHSLSRI